MKDITDDVESWDHELNGAAASMMEIEDKMYGVPFDLGIVGVWYSKALFQKAGIDAPPETWDELLDDVEKLKDAGDHADLARRGDKWPAMFWYGYLALRIAGAEVMQQAGIDENFDDPAFIRAGEEIERLVALEPFQSGFLATPWDGPDGAAAPLERQGRDAADGPLGARHDGGERTEVSAMTSAGSRSRRSKAATAIRRTLSAAATASPSARMRRPRRSSSWSTSRAPRSRSGSAAWRSSCRRPSARRTRSPTRTSST